MAPRRLLHQLRLYLVPEPEPPARRHRVVDEDDLDDDPTIAVLRAAS
jgi:hypothetical protein